MSQLDDCDAFTDHGRNGEPPTGYKKIRVHLVFDDKHYSRHKARCVADGHLTDIPVNSIYFGVVSLRGLRLIIFLVELSGIKTWATNINSACLKAKTNQKVCIAAGPEFGILE
jgi:hypothetical protein